MSLPEGPQRFLRFTRQSHHSCSLPALLLSASPASRTRVSACLTRQSTAAQAANCVPALRAPHASLQTNCARAPPCKSANVYVGKTYTQFATWAAYAIRWRLPTYGCLKWVRRRFGALATGTDQGTGVRSVGTLGARGQTSRIGGVSRFLLPTFLCGGKEK